MARNNLYCTGSLSESATWRYSSPARAFPCFLFIFPLIGLFVAFATAQAPNPASWMAFATIDEETLYIQGGASNGSLTSQFFALDLTQSSWNTSNPPWKALTLGSGTQAAPIDDGHSMTISKDKQSLIVWGWKTGISVFNITSGLWTPSPMPSNSSLLDELRAVTDPGSGLIYIPTGANKGLNMMQYDPSTGNSQVLPMPAQIANYTFKYYSAAWSTQRSTILLYGGMGSITNPFLWEYVPGTSSWSLVSTTGPSPEDVERHCMVPAYNGTKMVVFGGNPTVNIPLGGIYILNVQDMSWTKGIDITPSSNRSDMACAIAGDNFVAWGGDQNNNNVGMSGTPIIYNLKTNQWTTQFSLPAPTVPAGTINTPNTPNTPNKSNSGAAIGGAVAGVIVLAVIVYFVHARYETTERRRDDSLISSLVAMENVSDSNSKQSVNVALPETRPNYDQHLTNKRVHAPNYFGQSPQSILTKDTIKDTGYDTAKAAPKDSNVDYTNPLQSESHALSQSPQDYGQMTPDSQPELRSPKLRQAYEDNAGLEAQIAQMKAQHAQQQQRQERLEHLQLQQQAQLRMLEQQLIASKRDTNAK
ncbi:hypothetical protein BGX26_004223 [Mortierella sp. AD094]|nr:hypothetical protein BGX26_004223 [Mortierella sp. AD094]